MAHYSVFMCIILFLELHHLWRKFFLFKDKSTKYPQAHTQANILFLKIEILSFIGLMKFSEFSASFIGTNFPFRLSVSSFFDFYFYFFVIFFLYLHLSYSQARIANKKKMREQKK